MGSWSETCAISNLPISCGDEIYVILLTQTPYMQEHAARSGCYSTDFWFPRSLPVLGTYDDYGRIKLLPSEEFLGQTVLDQLKHDLVEVDQGPNQYHDTVVKKKDLTWDYLDALLHEGRCWIDNKAEDRLSRAEMKKIRAETKLASGEAKDPDEDNPYVIQSRVNYANRDAAKQALFESIYPGVRPGSSPVTRIYIRKDVYDYIQSSQRIGWPDGMSAQSFHQQAQDTLQAILKPSALEKGLPKELNKKWRRTFRMAAAMSVDRDNIFASFLSGGSNLFIPFTVGPRWTIEKLFDKHLSRKCSAKNLKLAVARMAELILIDSMLYSCRMHWSPTTGTGSQSEEYKRTADMHAAFAKIGYDEEMKAIANQWGWHAGSTEDWWIKDCAASTDRAKALAMSTGQDLTSVLATIVTLAEVDDAELKSKVLEKGQLL